MPVLPPKSSPSAFSSVWRRGSLAIISETAASVIRNADLRKRIIRQHEDWERPHDIPNLLPLLDDELPAPPLH